MTTARPSDRLTVDGRSRATPRRGRPQRLPVDPSDWGSATYDSSLRVAWLLAVTRLLSPATSAESRRSFIASMGEHGVHLDTPRVSRLETGDQAATTRVIRGYERVTGVPAGSLRSVSTLLRGQTGVEPGADKGTPFDPAVLDDSFDRLDHGKGDGQDWLRIATEIDGDDRIYLPPTAWADLSSRLVVELTRSTGVAHVRRYAAATRLMRHPAGQRHLTMAIGRFVMNSDVQSVAPSLSLLQEVSDHPTGDLVVRLMGESNPLLRRGAAGVAATLASRDGFAESTFDAIEHHVGSELGRNSATMRRSDAIDLASRLPEERYARIIAAIQDSRTRASVTRACSSKELVERSVSRGTVEAIATYAEAAAGRIAHDPDQMLRRLLREALFHLHRERRQLAAVTLAASPYARPVAQAALAVAQDTHEVAAAMSWSLLRRLGHVLDRGEVAEVAFTETRKGLRAPALVTLGLSRGALPEAAAAQLVDLARTRGGTRSGHAAVFALGMSGHPCLEALANGTSDAQRAARWWTTVGPALHD